MRVSACVCECALGGVCAAVAASSGSKISRAMPNELAI